MLTWRQEIERLYKTIPSAPGMEFYNFDWKKCTIRDKFSVLDTYEFAPFVVDFSYLRFMPEKLNNPSFLFPFKGQTRLDKTRIVACRYGVFGQAIEFL